MQKALITLFACSFLSLSAIGASADRADAPALAIVPQSYEPPLPFYKLFIEPITIEYDASSSVRHLKPEHEARLNEAVAGAIRAAVGTQVTVVEAPGPGVLRVQAAITSIRAEEKRKRFWSYTPFGLLKGRIDAATGRDFVLVSATVEVELYDGESGQELAAVSDLTASNDESDDAELSFRTLVAKIGGWTHQLFAQLATA